MSYMDRRLLVDVGGSSMDCMVEVVLFVLACLVGCHSLSRGLNDISFYLFSF